MEEILLEGQYDNLTRQFEEADRPIDAIFMMVHNENCVLLEKGKTSAVIIAATDFSQRMSRCGPISFSYGTLCQAQLDIGKKYENWSSGKF